MLNKLVRILVAIAIVFGLLFAAYKLLPLNLTGGVRQWLQETFEGDKKKVADAARQTFVATYDPTTKRTVATKITYKELIEKKSEYDTQMESRDDLTIGEETQNLDDGYTGEEDSGVDEDDIADKMAEGTKSEPGEKTVRKAVRERVIDALPQIIEYSDLDEERAENFKKLIAEYTALPDKSSTEDNVRLMRRKIT